MRSHIEDSGIKIHRMGDAVYLKVCVDEEAQDAEREHGERKRAWGETKGGDPMMSEGLIFFDIDGTLTRGVSSGTFVAEHLGIGEEMRAAEEAYARGEMDNAAVCRVDAAGYAGLRVGDVEAWLGDMPLIDGIVPALCRLARYRACAVIASRSQAAQPATLPS